MLKFAANLHFLFNEVPLLDRFEAAAAAGFTAVECPYPYAHEVVHLATLLDRLRLRLVLINTSAGAIGEHGLACMPGREQAFRESIAQGAEYARGLGCPIVHVLAGVAPRGETSGRAYRTYVNNVAWAAEALARHNVKAAIEAINGRDVPGYFLDTPRMAMQVLHDASVPNLYLQFDVYHAQVTQGDLARSLEAYFPSIGHIQVADPPHRHEPGTGEINFPFLFQHIDALGYEGWIGCEYRPARETLAGLEWVRPYLQAAET